MLLDDFRNTPGVGLFHMACSADKDSDKVVFLYKFIRGECPSSFGMNVARMAGIPDSVIAKAKRMSLQFKEELNEISQRMQRSRLDEV